MKRARGWKRKNRSDETRMKKQVKKKEVKEKKEGVKRRESPRTKKNWKKNIVNDHQVLLVFSLNFFPFPFSFPFSFLFSFLFFSFYFSLFSSLSFPLFQFPSISLAIFFCNFSWNPKIYLFSLSSYSFNKWRTLRDFSTSFSYLSFPPQSFVFQKNPVSSLSLFLSLVSLKSFIPTPSYCFIKEKEIRDLMMTTPSLLLLIHDSCRLIWHPDERNWRGKRKIVWIEIDRWENDRNRERERKKRWRKKSKFNTL